MDLDSDIPHIKIFPASAAYADQMQALQFLVYDAAPDDPGDCLTAAMFRRHLEVFPAGQFIALDTKTDQVVGLTSSMRMNFDRTRPFVEPWMVTIGYG